MPDVTGSGREEIIVRVHDPGDQPRFERFMGRWLVRPARDRARPEEPGYGEYWGVAQTKRGQIAVYNAAPDGAWAELAIYASLAAAERSGCIPASIVEITAEALTQDRTQDVSLSQERHSPLARPAPRVGVDGTTWLDI